MTDQAAPEIDCVCLTCFESSFLFFASLLRSTRIRLHRAETLSEAGFLLTVTGATVLLTDIVFLDGSWRDAVELLAGFHPRVEPVVIAEPIDAPFVSDALERGACAVIWKPFDFTCLRRLIQAADEASANRAARQASPHAVC